MKIQVLEVLARRTTISYNEDFAKNYGEFELKIMAENDAKDNLGPEDWEEIVHTTRADIIED